MSLAHARLGRTNAMKSLLAATAAVLALALGSAAMAQTGSGTGSAERPDATAPGVGTGNDMNPTRGPCRPGEAIVIPQTDRTGAAIGTRCAPGMSGASGWSGTGHDSGATGTPSGAPVPTEGMGGSRSGTRR